jgi:hypothetical protein
MSHVELPLPELLGHARGAFGSVIRESIANAGLPALPRDGAFILGGLHFNDVPLPDLIQQRAASLERHQTISHLVKAGYLEERDGDLVLTGLGIEGAVVVAEAVGGLYHELGHAVGEEGISTLRKALVTLIEIKENAEEGRLFSGHVHDESPHGGGTT